MEKSKYPVVSDIKGGTIIAVRTVQDRGRVQIPKKIRDKLGLEDGNQVYWVEIRGCFHLAKAKKIE